MEFKKDMLLLYAVTDRTWEFKQSLYEQIEDAILGGVTMVQLREKNLCEEEYVLEARRVKEICHRHGIPLIINDNVDVALQSKADGVHVGMEDTPICEIRKRVGNDFIVGATAKTVKQAVEAQKAGADYLGVGAVFTSPTKKNAIRITTDRLKEICDSVEIPVVAIGGINLTNMEKLRGGGMDGIAVVSAIFGKEDRKKAAKDLRERVERLV